MKKWLWLLALSAPVWAQDPAFEESLAKAKRHPAAVRALHFSMSEWPFAEYKADAVSFPASWPQQLNMFSNLEVIEADGLGGNHLLGLWQGPSPFPRLRRVILKNLLVNFQEKTLPQFGGLEALGLRGTDRVGEIYASLAGASSLRQLDLSFGQLALSATPPKWGQMRELDLSETGLTQLPPWIGGLTNLEYLDLSGNQLTALPPELFGLKKLRELRVSGNQFNGRGPWQKLTSLQRLDLNHNPLQTVGELPALIELDLSAAGLTQLPALPASLRRLRASRNQLKQLPAFPPQLEELDLSYNQLTEAPRLTGAPLKLNLSFNQLTAFQAPAGLSELNLSHNQFSQFGCTGIPSLDLSANRLTALPECTGCLTLNLASNRIAALPEIPPAGLEKLGVLALHANLLREIPAGWGGLKLKTLILSLNPLESFPPSGFENTHIEMLGHRLKAEQLELLRGQHPGLVATAEGPPNFSQSTEPGPEEYRVLRCLLAEGVAVEYTVNGYSPVGRSLEKRKRFYAALQHLKKLPPDLVSSYAFNNLERSRLDSARLGLPLLLDEERVLAEEDSLELRSRRQIIVAVSRVGFSYDGQMALAYCQSAAGRLNCLGALVVLRKLSGEWRIVDNIAVWSG